MQAGCGLSDTGERLIFDLHHDQLFAAEHLARYHWAAQIAPGKRVADVACGSGYGSQMLMEGGALRVIGIDSAADAISYARAKYRCDGSLSFVMGDAAALPLADASIDLLVSFETLEHVANCERMIAEASRVLDSRGTLLVSTPNPRVYPSGNPFHVSELAPRDFESLLKEQFQDVELFYQIDWLSSSIMDNSVLKSADFRQALAGSVYKISSASMEHCPYVLAVCRKSAANGFDAQPVTVLIRDQQSQLADVRSLREQAKNAKADEIIAHYQQHEVELVEWAKRTGEAAQSHITALESANRELGEAVSRLTSSNAELIDRHREAVEAANAEVAKRDESIAHYQRREAELMGEGRPAGEAIIKPEISDSGLTEVVAQLARTNADLMEHHQEAIRNANEQLLVKDEALDELGRSEAAALESQRQLAAAATAALEANREILERASAELAARDASVRHYQVQELTLSETQRQLANTNAALVEQHREAVERGQIEAAKRDEAIAHYQGNERQLIAMLNGGSRAGAAAPPTALFSRLRAAAGRWFRSGSGRPQ